MAVSSIQYSAVPVTLLQFFSGDIIAVFLVSLRSINACDGCRVKQIQLKIILGLDI